MENDFGLLACVLQPEASAMMTSDKTYTHVGNNTARNPIDMFSWIYRYDGFGRCIAKKAPGAGWTYNVYDQAHRQILTQTALQRETSEWSFCKYDRFGRLVQSGTAKNTATHQALQNLYADKTVVESWQSQTGYTNNFSPGSNMAIFTQNYYDNYDFLNRSTISTFIKNSLSYTHIQGFDSVYARTVENVDISLRGVLTGTSVALVGMAGEKLTAMYYDREGRIVQSHSTNHLGGYDRYFFRYDFSGNVLKMKHKHYVDKKDEITENYEYTYDDAGRQKAVFHSIDNMTPVKISEMEYDELCRVKKKTLHGNMYSTNYGYNLQSQLNMISSPKFSQTLRRHDGTKKKYYNGSISEISETLNGKTINYAYSYDALKRLVSVESTSARAEYNHAFDMNLSYDRNGNITDITRKAWIYDYNSYHIDEDGYPEERVDVLDNLHFEYTGNMAWYACGSSKDEIPYVSYTSSWLAPSNRNYPNRTCYQIAYDANGNRRCDENRRIAWIKYNSLNLPYKVQGMDGNKTEYIYYATGEKIRAIETVPMNPMQIPLGATGTESTNIKTTNKTDYCTNFHYYNGALKYILTPDGYIEASNASKSNWRHVYSVKDYQGNVRGELLSATLATPAATTYSLRNAVNYYAFGLRENSYSGALFQYGGNEQSKDRDNSFDFNFRRLDPQLCRFTTQDPLAEMNFSISPYAYCSNDPINRIDPLGLMPGLADSTAINLFEVVVTPEGNYIIGYSGRSSESYNDIMNSRREWLYGEGIRERERLKYEKAMAEIRRKNRELEDNMLRNSIAEIISLDLAEELFGFASSEFSAAGNIRQNELFWLDAKDKFHSTKSLKVGANGKYVKGVQGLRNSYAIAKDAAKLAKGFGKVFAFAGVVINGYDMLENGINVSNSMDVIMIAAGFIPVAGWMISGVYFIANIATEMATGQSISQHTQNWVESW